MIEYELIFTVFNLFFFRVSWQLNVREKTKEMHKG